MTNWARVERSALCDLFLRVGPDSPTLCGEWTARDLAAHLVVRERRPDAAGGIMLSALAGYTDKVQSKIAAGDWHELVATVRSGPPLWSPIRVGALDRLTNTIEFFVHHEDVRRALSGWTARELDPEFEQQLWGFLRRGAKLMTRKAPAGLVLRNSLGGDAELTAHQGSPTVTVAGAPSELVLFVYGRQAHSLAVVDGEASAVDAMRTASFGI